MARHENRRRKSVDEEEDYDFKTKRQIVNEFEFAPETAENLDTLEGQSKDDFYLLAGALKAFVFKGSPLTYADSAHY